MNRDNRIQACAKETVAICEAGFYLAPSGKRIEIAAALKTRLRERCYIPSKARSSIDIQPTRQSDDYPGRQ